MSVTPEREGRVRRALATRPWCSVAWVAASGDEAVVRCRQDKPDLVVIDIIGGKLDGAEITRRIMATSPCAVLVVTDSVRADAGRVFDAMGRGALDAADMPAVGDANFSESAAELLVKIASIARRIGVKDGVFAPERPLMPLGDRAEQLIVIGASAGGPAALAALLGALRADIPASIVVVQHVDSRFAAGMTDWLSRSSPLTVRVAREGDRLLAGQVLMAGTNEHLILKTADRLGYTPEPHGYAYCPSIDVFFQSVSRLWRGEVVGLLLTGMGRDGAAGLKALRTSGHHTIAQDEATSAVYGMPKAAAAIDAAVDILPMERIASRLVEVLSSKVRGGRL